MGTNEIIEKIKSEAHAEYERIISEAKENATKKLEEAKKELELQKKRSIEAEERKGAEEKERIIRAARQHGRKLKWMVEEEMIEKVFQEALKRMKEVKREGFKENTYPTILAGLILDGAMSIATGSRQGEEFELLVSEEDASYIDQPMLKRIHDTLRRDKGVDLRLSLSRERIKTAGGVIVRRRDGKIEVSNTVEQRMARFSTGLREDIVKTLFSEK
ncbi:MAG: hypothetical protein EFT35_00040 [Methanophagales archaeon ANME-1-THS]|nr:MAG: hypothetical protein EFT35_00040 [Methanophagales archaeon ANME-1-THS]